MIVNQLAGLVAVQLHPVVVVIAPDAEPPAAGSDCVVGDTVKEHAAAA